MKNDFRKCFKEKGQKGSFYYIQKKRPFPHVKCPAEAFNLFGSTPFKKKKNCLSLTAPNPENIRFSLMTFWRCLLISFFFLVEKQRPKKFLIQEMYIFYDVLVVI